MFLVSAALVLAMQTAPDAPVQIVLKASSEGCTTMVDGAHVDQEALEAHAIRWARSGRSVELSGDAEAPYRCIGGLIFALQKAGFGSYFGTDFSSGLRMRISVAVKLGISPRCEISVNGRPATFAEYDGLAAQWGRNQPEIHFLPDPDAHYECVDRVLQVLKKHNTTKLGFVGYELHTRDDE